MMTARISPLNNALVVRRGARPVFAFDRLFDSAWRGFANAGGGDRRAAFGPRVDIQETDAAYRICVELPGLGGENILVEVEDGLLSVSGKQKAEVQASDADGSETQGSERCVFQRSYKLPEGVDVECVKARYADGVLTVSVPKPADPEPEVRAIPVEIG